MKDQNTKAFTLWTLPHRVIRGYKQFQSGLKCRDYQFEVGVTHLHEGELELCYSGFHFCRLLNRVPDTQDIFSGSTHRVLCRDVVGNPASKECCREIMIVSGPLSFQEWLSEANDGERNLGYGNQGDGNKGNWNQGNGNKGYGNQGNGNKGDDNRGDKNQGDWNRGDENKGYGNRGNWNRGDGNLGDRNQGDENRGNGNKGYGNWGNENKGNGNKGNLRVT